MPKSLGPEDNPTLASFVAKVHASESLTSDGTRLMSHSNTYHSSNENTQESSVSDIHKELFQDPPARLGASQNVSERSPDPVAIHLNITSERLHQDASVIDNSQEPKRFSKLTKALEPQPPEYIYPPGPMHQTQRFHLAQSKPLHMMDSVSMDINLSPHHRCESQKRELEQLTPTPAQSKNASAHKTTSSSQRCKERRSASKSRQHKFPIPDFLDSHHFPLESDATATLAFKREDRQKLPNRMEDRCGPSHELEEEAEKGSRTSRESLLPYPIKVPTHRLSHMRCQSREVVEIARPVEHFAKPLSESRERRHSPVHVAQQPKGNGNELSELSHVNDLTFSRKSAAQERFLTPVHAISSASVDTSQATSPAGDLAKTGSHKTETPKSRGKEASSSPRRGGIQESKQSESLSSPRPPNISRSTISRQSNISKPRSSVKTKHNIRDAVIHAQLSHGGLTNEGTHIKIEKLHRLEKYLKLARSELADKRQRINVGQQQLRQLTYERDRLQNHNKMLEQEIQRQVKSRQMQDEDTERNNTMAVRQDRNENNARIEKLEVNFKRYKDHLNLFIERLQWLDEKNTSDFERSLQGYNKVWEERFSKQEAALNSGEEARRELSVRLQEICDTHRDQEEKGLKKAEERILETELALQEEKAKTNLLAKKMDEQTMISETLGLVKSQNENILAKISETSRNDLPSIEELLTKAAASFPFSKELTQKASELERHLDRLLSQRLKPLEDQLQKTRDAGALIQTSVEKNLKDLRLHTITSLEHRAQGESSLLDKINNLCEELATKTTSFDDLNQRQEKLEKAHDGKNEMIREIRTKLDDLSTEFDQLRVKNMNYPVQVAELQDAQIKAEQRIQNLKIKIRQSSPAAAISAADEAHACMEAAAQEWKKITATLFQLEKEAPSCKEMNFKVQSLLEIDEILCATLQKCEKKADELEALTGDRVTHQSPKTSSESQPQSQLDNKNSSIDKEPQTAPINGSLKEAQAVGPEKTCEIEAESKPPSSSNSNNLDKVLGDPIVPQGKKIILQTPVKIAEELGMATLSHIEECEQRRYKSPGPPILRMSQVFKLADGNKNPPDSTPAEEFSTNATVRPSVKFAGHRKYSMSVEGRPKVKPTEKGVKSQAALKSIKSGLLSQACATQTEGLTSPDAWTEGQSIQKRPAKFGDPRSSKRLRVSESDHNLRDSSHVDGKANGTEGASD